MSAFVVSTAHVSLLVQAAMESGSAGGDRMRWHRPDNSTGEILPGEPESESAAVRMLWLENVASVVYRYEGEPLADLPGVASELEAHAAFGWAPTYTRSWTRGEIPPVVALKALKCYEYQSCERPGWESSEAHEFCRVLRHRLIARLPGWDAAPWDWDGEQEAAA